MTCDVGVRFRTVERMRGSARPAVPACGSHRAVTGSPTSTAPLRLRLHRVHRADRAQLVSSGYINDVTLFVASWSRRWSYVWRASEPRRRHARVARGDRPDDDERGNTWLPFRIAVRPMIVWSIAAVMFSVLSLSTATLGMGARGRRHDCARRCGELCDLVPDPGASFRPVFALALEGEAPSGATRWV